MIRGLFDRTIDTIGSSLDLRAMRHKLLASNIANQETPGYRAIDIKFSDEMKKRVIAQGGETVLASTNPKHIPVMGAIPGEPAVIDRATDYESYDKNSVGIEGEMAKLSENSLMYSISSKMIRAKFSMLMTAIKEGGR